MTGVQTCALPILTTFNNYYQLYAELNVFDGFATINALKQAKLSRDYSATAMQKIQDDRAIDVMQKYVDAVYAEASIRIASEKLNESKRMLDKMKRLYELGEKGRPDVVQMESQVAEDEYMKFTPERKQKNAQMYSSAGEWKNSVLL